MSHQALNPQNLSPLGPSSLQSEESFIVIARSSSPNSANVPELVNGPTSTLSAAALNESMTVSGLTSSSILNGLSPDEIQNKVQALVEENGQLKEALRQNNLAMKKQFDTLVKWQEEVFKVHQNHKLKFEETKDLVLKLKAENAELRKVIADLESSQQSSTDLAKLQAENVSLKRKLSEAEAKEKVVCLKEFQLKKEIADLKGQVEELQKKLTQFQDGKSLSQGPPSKQPSDVNAVVTAEKEELGGDGSLNQLGSTVSSGKTNFVGNSFVVVNEAWKNLPGMVEPKTLRSAEDEATRRQLEEHQKVLDVERQALEEDRKALERNRRAMCDKLREAETSKKRAELEKDNLSMRLADVMEQLHQERESGKELARALEERLKESGPQAHAWESIKPLSDEGNMPIKACESRLGLIREYLISQEKKNIKIEVWMQKLHQIIVSLMAVDPDKCKELREEVLNLKMQITDDADELQNQRVHLREAENLLADLKLSYDTIQAKEASVSSVIKENAEADYHKAQARGYRQKLDDVTARLAHAEDALGQARSETASMAERLRMAEVELEAVPILKTQVEVYQSDFNTEREERARMAAEKQQLTEEVQRLRARNQQLLEDMENFERREARENRTPPDGTASTAVPGGGAAPRVNVFNTLAAPGRGSQHGYRVEEPDQRQATPDRTTRGSSEPKVYTCPKCFRAYMELGPLEVHVNQCLDTP